MKTITIDCETTGFDSKNDGIIELAAIFEGQVFHEYCIPFKKKPEGFDKITDLTGITWDFLKNNGLKEEDLYLEFVEWLQCECGIDKFDKKDKAVFCGYNARFDADFIRNLFSRQNDNYFGSFFVSSVLDVSSMVADALSRDKIPMLDNYKLETVCNHFGIEFKAHSALEDVMATDKLRKELF